MPCVPAPRLGDVASATRPEAGEIKSGILDIVPASKSGQASAALRQRVFVKVYRTSSEHFAALFPARALASACRPVACVNLKSCSVEGRPGSPQIRLSPRFCDGVSLTLAVPDATDQDGLLSWLASLKDCEKAERKRTLSDPRKALPVLVEEDE